MSLFTGTLAQAVNTIAGDLSVLIPTGKVTQDHNQETLLPEFSMVVGNVVFVPIKSKDTRTWGVLSVPGAMVAQIGTTDGPASLKYLAVFNGQPLGIFPSRLAAMGAVAPLVHEHIGWKSRHGEDVDIKFRSLQTQLHRLA